MTVPKIVSYDTETLTHSKGNAYDTRNKLCLAGVYDGEEYDIYDIEYSDTPYREQVELLGSNLLTADLIVMFNAKFEIAWSRNYGIDLSDCKIWDCQLVHFILTNQTTPYPSLNGVAEYYGLGSKLDKIAEYWDAGIQTDEIDYDELREYLEQDVSLTLQIYYKQMEELNTTKQHLRKLVQLSNMDILTLADMEWHGLLYDFDLSAEKAESLTKQISDLDAQLISFYDIEGLNWNSNDHLSAILYGGLLKTQGRETVERTLKDGTVKVSERNCIIEQDMPRLVDPLPRSECAKEGYWKTSEDVLKSLKAKGKAKEIIQLVLKRSLLDKELNTYALGMKKLYDEKHYSDNIIHTQFNQVVARTGRISSSQPNAQNFSKGAKECIISRYQ